MWLGGTSGTAGGTLLRRHGLAANHCGGCGQCRMGGARRQPAGCMCGEAGASSDETDCTETALSDDGTGPSQCLVERCSSAVCFCPHGLPLGKGMHVSTPLTFLCQDLSKALAAGT